MKTQPKYRKHFNNFDLYKRDLSNMRLKREIEENEEKKLEHFSDMKKSSDNTCKDGTNYRIYKPIYNIYKNHYEGEVQTNKKQLESYNSILKYLDTMLESGTLSKTNLENTRREQKEILREMNTINSRIKKITSIDGSIK
tara:strand:+ start:407 stop:826 length:420 start_codon:yes stop_codon:yes gene_type:complete